MTAVGVPRLTEADLFEIWRGQRFPEGALVTRAGVPVRVLSAGRVGRGPGPDFRNAGIAGPSGAVAPRRRRAACAVVDRFARTATLSIRPTATSSCTSSSRTTTARDTLAALAARSRPSSRWPAGWRGARKSFAAGWSGRCSGASPAMTLCARLGRAGVNRALDAEGDRRMRSVRRALARANR